MTTLATLVIDLKADATGVKKGFDEAGSHAKGFGGVVKNVIGTMGGFMLANAAMNVIGSAWHALTGSVIDLNSNIEQTTNVFRTLMGSASMAKAKVTELFDFAARSPFTVQSVEAGALILQKLGGNALNSSKNLEMIGNIAAGLHVPFESMASTIARFHMILDAGQPITRAIRPLMMMGAVSASTAAEIMKLSKAHASHAEILKVLDASFGRFSGAMDRQGGTWEGLTKTFNDTLSVLGARTLKPFFKLAEEGLGQLNKLLGSKDFESFANGAAGAIAGFASALGQMWPSPLKAIATALVGDLKIGFQFIHDHGDEVKGALLGIAAGFIAWNIPLWITAAAATAAGIGEMLALWPLLLLAIAIGAVVIVGYELISHWGQLSAAAKKLASEVGGVFSAFGTKVHAIWTSIIGTVEAAAKAFFDRPFYWLARLSLLPAVLLGIFLGHVIIWAIQLNALAIKTGTSFIHWLGYWIGKLPGLAQTFLLNMLNTVLMFPIKFNKAATDIGTSIWKAITGFNWAKLGYNLIEGIKSGITSGVMALLGTVKNVAGQVLQGFKDAFGIHSPSAPLFAMGQNLSMALGGGIHDKKSAAHGAFDSLIGGLSGASGDVRFTGSGSIASNPSAGGDFMEMQRTLNAILRSHQALLEHVQKGADITGVEAKLVALIDKGKRAQAKGARLGWSPT